MTRRSPYLIELSAADRARLDITAQLVSKWRKRFFEEGLDGLKDRPRTGRPRAFPPCGGGDGQGAGL